MRYRCVTVSLLAAALAGSIGMSCQQAPLSPRPQVNPEPAPRDFGPLVPSPDRWSDAAIRTFEELLKPRTWTPNDPTPLAMIQQVSAALPCASAFDSDFAEQTSKAPAPFRFMRPVEKPAFQQLDLIFFYTKNADGVPGAYAIRQDGSLRFGWAPDLAPDHQADLAAILAGRQRVGQATEYRSHDWDGIDDEPRSDNRKMRALLKSKWTELKLSNASAQEAAQALQAQNIRAHCSTLLGSTGQRFDFKGRGPLPLVLDQLCAVSGLGWHISSGDIALASPSDAQREHERIATRSSLHASQVAALERRMDSTATSTLADFAKDVQRIAGIPVIAMPDTWTSVTIKIRPDDSIRNVLERAREAGNDWALHDGYLCFLGRVTPR